MYKQFNKPNSSNSGFGGPRKFGSRPGYNSRFRSARPVKQKFSPEADLVRRIEMNMQIKETHVETVVYENKHTFESFPLVNILKENVKAKGYTSLTPIQDQAIPVVLEGKDVIGIANTGTGKTAAFLIPLINKVFKNRSTEKVLIITPTRELAQQIETEFRYFAKNMTLFSALCIGGTSLFKQKGDLRRNPQFVIGTPGRIKDLIKQKAIDMSKFNNVVLDETDRMVDIGFVEEIKYFISLLPEERQSLFFSATITPKVREILESFVKEAVMISVKKQETSKNVTQDLIKVQGQQKIEHLHEILIKQDVEKVIVFGRTKVGVEKLSKELNKRGFKAGAIHGDIRQSQRQRILNEFKSDRISILLATDVAARGLDIKDVSHVINYDLPNTYDDYVHRIGRTGRANKKGVALTFVD